jgi:hypothetical protein
MHLLCTGSKTDNQSDTNVLEGPEFDPTVSTNRKLMLKYYRFSVQWHLLKSYRFKMAAQVTSSSEF